MMYSMEKCLGRNGTGTPEEADLFAGGGEGLGQEGVPSDDVVLVSAVASVSHEIGDILKDELGDAERADRIGAELADLSAELGLLAGLADGDTQQDFPVLLKLAMGDREIESSGSSTSSSSWSRARARRPSRPTRVSRRRPIAKGKEVSRRRSAAARRAACMRIRRVEVVSDASDVGADSDSDDQWTELEDGSSGSGSADSSTSDTSSKSGTEMDHHGPPNTADPPQLCQFLLPLITNVPNSYQFRIRHDDIIELLKTDDDQRVEDLPSQHEALMTNEPDELSAEDMFAFEEPPVTPEEEATLLHYVCGGERGSMATFQPTEEWLLGVFHSWCEVSGLVYTLIGTNATVRHVCGPWGLRVRIPCYCRLCICRVRAEPALACLLRDLVWTLAHGGSTVPNAAHIMRALRLSGDAPLLPEEWDIPRLKRIQFSDEGAAIIHNQLVRYSQQNETARQIITTICNCRIYDKPLEKEYAVERFIKILESYKSASIVRFKVEMIPLNDDPETIAWIAESGPKLERYLRPLQDSLAAVRLHTMATRTKPEALSTWMNYKHKCECTGPQLMCAYERKQLLKSIYSRMSVLGLHRKPETDESGLAIKGPADPSEEPELVEPDTAGNELQQGDGTEAKPPDSGSAEECCARAVEWREAAEEPECGSEDEHSEDMDDIITFIIAGSFLTVTDSDENSNTASLGLSTSSLDSASELLLAAAHAVDSDTDPAPTELCRTVRHLMRSIASIERHMDTVLKQCDEWPTGGNDVEARKQVDLGLSEVDRKLMAMYRRLPEVHRRQLQVYRKQKKLSTVCMQLVGGAAPAPPPPGSPPPAPHHLPCRALCPEYHLQRFKEVRRKVMHMRDQQLYYHRLRMWLEDQLRQERDSIPDSSVEDAPRRRRRAGSPKFPRLSTATKRKLKPNTISKPHRILQLLRHKAQTTQLLNDIKNDESKEADPPEPFPLDKEDNISDTDTIVGEKDVDMSSVLATLAQMALSPDKRIQKAFADLKEEYANIQPTPSDSDEEYPESVSPPLQENSPTTSEPIYKQRLIVKKFPDTNAQIPELNVPLNARRTPDDDKLQNEVAVYKDPNIYKYVTFGLEIKKAMEECQNIINSYNSIKTDKEENDGPLSLEQICEVMMSLDKNSAEFLSKIDDEPIDMNATNTKFAELVENMPQILANMPEIASEFANASFELPEFASIMSSLPDANSEAQLTPETLKQIRELKISKRDSVKVTKNTAKRKISRKVKNYIETDIIGTMTFEFDSKDITDLLNDEKELQALMKCKTHNKHDFRELLFSISAQVVVNKVFEAVKANKNPELARCMERELLALPRNSINSEMYAKASTLFDNSVKDALSMEELRESVRTRFDTWKHYVATEFKSIPAGLLDSEIDAMLDKFYHYIKDLANKQTQNDRDKIIEKLEGTRKKQEYYDSEEDAPSKESIKQITKILSVSAGNTFDLLLMKMSRMTGEKRAALKNMRFKYVDVLKRCAESQQLVGWILSDPDLAANHIQQLMGFAMRNQENPSDFSTMPIEKKRVYFMDRLKEINRHFMENISRKSLTGDEWLVMLYRLEQFENRIKSALVKFSPPLTTSQNASEAEILAAKGLSKIIGKANNLRVVKKPDAVSQPTPAALPAPASVPTSLPANVPTSVPVSVPTSVPASIPTITPESVPTSVLTTPVSVPSPTKIEEKPEPQPKPNETPNRREVILKCEVLIAQKGNKALKDSFDAIKSYLAGDESKPDNYHDHVMAIVSNLDYSALDDEMVEVLQFGGITISPPAPAQTDNIKVLIPAHNPEELAKYSALALRNAKQTLNAVAFKNLTRNGQSKSESDISSCDVPSTECKYTSDCDCKACKRDRSVCMAGLGKVTCDGTEKSKSGLEEKKKEVKEVKVKTPAKAKPVPKQCENATHQQHVCKVGHTSNGNGSCTGEGGDQHCTCCYCTVFGHAPPLTTPVPRNFNETRERLRSILNKKKQLCKTANGDQNPPQETKQSPQPDKKPTSVPTPESPQPKPLLKVAQPQPKPPALPKTLPPNLTAQAQAKRQALDSQQRMLADKMAKMVVTEKPDNKPVALQRTIPVQVNVAPSLKTEGKVNASAMEQIRLQQLKQAQYQQQIALIKKPEPIYDLPIHNKSPHQQQQIRQELQKQQLQKQLLLQQKLKQNPVVHINPQPQNLQQATQVQQKPVLQQVPKPTLQQVQASQQKTLQQVPMPVLQQVPKPVLQQVPKPTLQQLQQQPALQQQVRLKTMHTQTLVHEAQPIQQKPAQQVQQNLTLQQQQAQQVQQKPAAPAQVQQIQQKTATPVQVQQKTGTTPVLQKLTSQQVQQKLPPQTVNRLTQAGHLQNQLKAAQQPQLLQKPPLQQAPRKPPPQELQQKLAQKQQQQPVQQKTASQQTVPTQQNAAVQAAPAQQQQPQQRQARQHQQNSVSLSSRDTSVFSTSSGCSDGSCWQGRAEDTRDLDALLQYIEGPTRHVDRGKKKAKKQRQKAKKSEERLQSECAQLKIEFARVRFEAEALRVAHYSAKRRCEETRKALQVMSAHNAPAKTRKKQNKLNPVQKQQIQVLAEQVGELTALMHTTAKELQTAETHVTECSQRLRECEKEINEARAMQGKKTPVQLAHEELKRYQHEQLQEQLLEQKQLLQNDEAHRMQTQQQWLQQQELQERQLRQQKQLQMHQLKQQRQLQLEQELMNRIRIDEAKLLKQRQNEAIAKADRMKATTNGSSERGVSSSSVSSSAGSVSSTGADRGASSPASSSGSLPAVQRTNRHIIIAKHMEEEDMTVQTPPKKEAPKKQTQTWEQALAHINQVAKGGKEKDKKKQKQPDTPDKPEVKLKEIKPTAEIPALSKKQKKKLAHQQAEEEERIQLEKLQKQEAKNKKNPVQGNTKKGELASPPVKIEPLTKKAEKKLEQAKRAEELKTKKEAKRERKLEKKAEKKEEKKAKEKETKEKENKPEKNVQVTTKPTKPLPPPQPQPQPPLTKKERKKEQQIQQNQKEKPSVVNITPHTTIELVNKNKNPCGDVDKPASCSIMEQLSCGIQVSELRLPPGITLTRVQPNEKKEAPAIKSVPLWKANQLPAAPTPVARPVPVINADPSMMMFSTAHPDQPPKPIIVAEPPPQPIGKSKKAKKKAKKAAAAAESEPKPEGTKMVTLRNPMFHPNLPPVQMSHTPPVQINNPKKPEQIRLPDPIPMPPNACQATITPTSNGMYTIRNPLMSMMHQQTMMGVRNPTPPFNQNQYYPNPNAYNPPGQYILDPTRTSPKPDEYQNRIMNLSSFTQQSDASSYSLFSTTDNQQKTFLSPEYYTDETPKPVISPNPIGTRPEINRAYDTDNSLFANPIQRPEPIGTPLKRDEDRSEYTGLYTPFGVENPTLFRSALFNEKTDVSIGKSDDITHLANGDLPYFQRLRVGSKLNNEVTIHHVTESKFYRQEPSHQTLSESPTDDSLFSRPLSHAWAEPLYPAHANPVITQALPRAASLDSPPGGEEPRFGAVGTRPAKDPGGSQHLSP